MKYKLIGLILLSLIMLTCQAYAVENFVGDRVPLKPGELTTKEKVTTVPSSTVLSVLTMYELNSKALLTGQTVTLVLPKDFYCNDKLIAPQGSVLTGNVVDVSKARQNGTDGRLNLRFSLITTPDGLQIPIVAVIKTDDLTGVLVGDSNIKQVSTKNTGKKKEQDVHSLKAVLNLGENVVIPLGTTIEIMLTQPITLTGEL